MPFNGSGVFQRVRNWVADAAAGIKIRADYHDSEDDGFAAGLSNCITKDGQTTITQNIPFNSKRITGLADPVNPQDAATKASVTPLATAATDGLYLKLAGGTMTSDLVLAADPDQPLEAATKQYTDAKDTATLNAAVAAAKAAGDAAYQAKDAQLFAGIPINNTSNYTTVATDSQKCIAGAGTITINSAVHPVGTVLTFAGYGGAMTIACSGSTIYWINGTVLTSGNRSLPDRGIATALRTPDGNWIIGGNGLT